MNLSQFILLFAAFIILSVSILLVNKNTLETVDERIQSKNQLQLIIETKNLFEEIKTKIYDEKIVSMISLLRDSLTSPSKFGPDGESYPYFDDIDDYHNYTRDIILDNLLYKLRVSVWYVNENNPNNISYTPTFYKLVKISCADRYQKQLFELNQIFSVW